MYLYRSLKRSAVNYLTVALLLSYYITTVSALEPEKEPVVLQNILVESLREAIPIELGQLDAGSTSTFTIQLKNGLTTDLSPDEVSRSCTCVNVAVPKEKWAIGAEIEIKIEVAVGDTADRIFRQRLTILDANRSLAAVVLELKAIVAPLISIEESSISILDRFKPMEKTITLATVNRNINLTKATLITNSDGLEFVADADNKNSDRVKFVGRFDPAKLFRGTPKERVRVMVRGAERNGQPFEFASEIAILFVTVSVPSPQSVRIFDGVDTWLGRVTLSGNYEGINAVPGSKDAGIPEVVACLPESKTKLKVTCEAVKPNVVTLRLYIPKNEQLGKRVLIRVLPNGEEISLPFERVSSTVED